MVWCDSLQSTFKTQKSKEGDNVAFVVRLET